MNKTKKTIVSLLLAAAMVAALAACGAKQEETSTQPAVLPGASEQALPPIGARWENGGVTLSVPAGVADLVLAELPQDDPDGVLFSVSEKQSVEDAAADGETEAGSGWLFGIRRVDEDALHELLCYDMSGAEVFAKDGAGNCYLYIHPTDVRLYRKDGDYASAMEQWSMLNEWAWNDVRRDLLAENAGLEAFERGNTMLDMYLARAAYEDGADYTVSTTQYGPLEGERAVAAPYVERLMGYSACEYADIGETPDGEYVVLSFPAEEMRYDFFRMEGKENYVREVGYNGEQLMKLSFDDGTKASELMQQWYDELALANGLGSLYATDEMVGRWAEKMAGRGLITIEKADDTYNIRVEWANGAAEQDIWEMSAADNGVGGELAYSDCRHYIRTFTSDTAYTDAEQYTNGTGRLYLNSAFEIMWEDDNGNAGEDCVFVNVG